ncbi:MAG TPA: 6-hydroxymethylpterin diphosphokinase MptE-like protein, partial [Tepidisphaeraceae bacterium]|nr:6-hydroxymethylpterin diphosphokinase MptE-like protein [Tepidisphaeraceae bacterium]
MPATAPQATAPATDASRRYVLPAAAPYLANLAALWAVDAKLAKTLEATPDAANVRVEPSRAGPPTAAVTHGGRAVHLHSRYQPLDEARKLVEGVDVATSLVVYVHGLGLGYHVERLFERTSDDAAIFVFEPDLSVLRAALSARDLSAVIASRRVAFFTDADKGELFTRLNQYTALVTAGVATVDHPPSVQLHPEFHAQVKRWLQEFADLSRTSINTLVLNGRRTAENIARNLAWYVAAPGIGRLKDRHKGQPAIIVSAGPSLRKNKHLLPAAAGKAVLIAAQTTLQPMLDLGVEPQYVTSLDYSDICTRFFERVPATVRTELVAEPKATSRIFAMHPGPIALLGNEFADQLLREMAPQIDKPRLPAGATVAHLAFYLAEHLGCDPIIFVGQDLGFSDGLSYVPGTGHDDAARPEYGRFYTPEMRQWDMIARDRRILRQVPDYQGRPTYTEERLFAYLQQFERDFLKSASRVIDATEGGAAKRGATPMPLADAVVQFCRHPLDLPRRERPPLQWERVEQALACLSRRIDEAQRVERIATDTLPLLRGVRDHLDDQA